MSDKFWGDLALMAGFGYGLYWFLGGFRVYREYQVLANTIALGREGKPAGE